MQISALQAASHGVASDPRQTPKLTKAASEFEALLIGQMLRSARESSAADSGDGDGAETNSSLMELGEQQLAQNLANSGGLGVAKIVIAGLSRNANR